MDGGQSFDTQGLEGGKMSGSQALALGTWSTSPTSGRTGGLRVQSLLLEMQGSLYLRMCHL